MVKTEKRRRFVGLNRGQRLSITLAVAPALVLFLFVFLLIEIFEPELSDVIITSTDEAAIVALTRWGVWLYLALAACFLAVMASTYVASRHVLGPFDRLLREMDEMLDGRRERKPLTVRPKDDLAKELLKRVNKLIERP